MELKGEKEVSRDYTLARAAILVYSTRRSEDSHDEGNQAAEGAQAAAVTPLVLASRNFHAPRLAMPNGKLPTRYPATRYPATRYPATRSLCLLIPVWYADGASHPLPPLRLHGPVI